MLQGRSKEEELSTLFVSAAVAAVAVCSACMVGSGSFASGDPSSFIHVCCATFKEVEMACILVHNCARERKQM